MISPEPQTPNRRVEDMSASFLARGFTNGMLKNVCESINRRIILIALGSAPQPMG